MKSLRRSVISSGIMWITYALFGYFVLIRGVFLTGQPDYLIFGNDGKNLLISIGYCIGFIVFIANAYKKAFLPLMKNPEFREFMKTYSEYLDEFKKFF